MDQCNDALTLAAYNFTTMAKTESFSHDLKTFFLSDRFNEWLQKHDDGFSIGLPPIGDLPPIQIGAKSSGDDISRFKERIVTMSDEQLRQYSDYYLKKQVVEPRALQEWGKCMNGHAATDIRGEVATAGQTVDVTLRWEKIGPKDEAPVIKAFYYEPLIPVQPFQFGPGATIDTDAVLQRFKRPSTEEILLSVSTTRGTWQAQIDAIAPLPEEKFTCYLYRTPADQPEELDMTGRHLSYCRSMCVDKFEKTGLNYSFKIRRYDSKGMLVSESAQNWDNNWPPAAIL